MSTLRAERVQPLRYLGDIDSLYGALLNRPREELQPVFTRIHSLSGLCDDWDGYGSKKPDPDALEYAEKWVEWFYNAALLSGFPWQVPLVNAGENGQIVFEWWGADPKKITVYISADSTYLVRVWGEDMNTEMQEMPLSDDFMQWRSLWHWLMHKD